MGIKLQPCTIDTELMDDLTAERDPASRDDDVVPAERKGSHE